ncbi:MAG: hypothetical protein GX327_09085 [Epulopiscium sp.]|nr:hypothetical protein [Candidatus Epulonipiscium sp.]
MFRKKEVSIDYALLKKIPILILDKKWHNIFPHEKKTKKILMLEKQLGNLLKEQGQLNNDFNDYIKLKKKLMSDIINLTDEVFSNENESDKEKMGKNKKYIIEINNKLEKIQKRLQRLPSEIEEVNQRLLRESVKVSYKEMKEHQEKTKELAKWIETTREQLKNNVKEKTIHEEKASEIYSYLHDLVGVELIEELDKRYWR